MTDRMLTGRTLRRLAAPLALALVIVSGCTGSGTLLKKTGRLGMSHVVATSADVRLVTVTPVAYDHDRGVVRPRQITCAEPSPDVAKMVTEAFGQGLALSGRGKSPDVPVEAQLNTTLALAKSHAEAVAQMTERLATIQLLRDGLYRACEAYANGAISETTYAVLVSRYDDTMITMLLGELAAGNFGRSLAALSGSAESKGSAKLAVERAQKRRQEAEKTAKQTQHDKEDAQQHIEAPPGDGEQSAEETRLLSQRLKEADRAHEQAQKELREAEDNEKQALEAEAESKAATQATAAGGIQKYSENAAIAISGVLEKMQRNYLQDHNVDSLKVACISSFGKELPGGRSEIVRETVTADGKQRQVERKRYEYSRALSVWCDELVNALKAEHESVQAVKLKHLRPQDPPAAIGRTLLQEMLVGGQHDTEANKETTPAGRARPAE